MKKNKQENSEKNKERKFEKGKNPMEKIKIEKIILKIGANGEELEKAVKLLQLITNKKPVKVKAKKRIQTLGISPGKEISCMVTLRREKAKKLLERLLKTIGNKLKEKQIKKNHFSFGIEEYIEIPDMEYDREIGMMGLDVTAVFSRPGKRVKIRKRKKGKVPKKQQISSEEICEFLKENFNVEILRRKK